MVIPCIGEDVLDRINKCELQTWYSRAAVRTGPMSVRVMSSRTFSIADFEVSAGGGLMSVGLGIMGAAVAQLWSRIKISTISRVKVYRRKIWHRAS